MRMRDAVRETRPNLHSDGNPSSLLYFHTCPYRVREAPVEEHTALHREQIIISGSITHLEASLTSRRHLPTQRSATQIQ